MKKPFITLTLLLMFSTQALSNDIDVTQLYQKAQSGDAQAQLDLANHYYTGEGVEKNEQGAVIWYRKAAEQGHAVAQFNLAYCYHNGIGVEKNEREAVIWYKEAARQGLAVAQNTLANCYFNGVGVEKNAQDAVIWYIRAAEQGYAEAQGNLAYCYYNGIGVEKNYQEANKYLKQYQKHVDAQNATNRHTTHCEKEIALNKKVEQAYHKYKDLGFWDGVMSDLGDPTVANVLAESIKALEAYRDHFVECDNPACKNKASEVIQNTSKIISDLKSEKNMANIFKLIFQGSMMLLGS